MMKFLLLVSAVLFCGYTHAQVQIVVDDTKQYQTIEGFGGFGSAKPWWEAPPHYDAAYLTETIDNLGVTFFRTQIYWDGEPSNDNPDPAVANASGFNFGPSSDNGKQFNFIKDLSARGAKVIATVWTPPTWMKLFDDDNRRPEECYNCYQCTVGSPGTEMCGGRLNPEYYEEFAEYLAVYVKTLKEKTGVDLYAISIQNEPFFANPFESNVVMPDEYAEILRVVGQRFRLEGLTTKFFGPEHMAEWSWGWQAKYVNEILGDEQVKEYLDIYAVHGYVDGVSPDYGSADGWTALHENITVAHGKPLWMTETSDFNLSGYPLAFNMTRSLYLALKFGRISAWIYWSMYDALLDKGQLTPLGYAFRQFYRFVPVGAKVIEVSSADASVLAIAFKHEPSGDMTVVLINNGESETNVDLTLPSTDKTLYLHRTSSGENGKDLGVFSGSAVILPAQSINTITTVSTASVTGVEKKSAGRFTVFPNPTNDQLKIQFPQNGESHLITISDHTGKTVSQFSSKGKGSIDINTKSWAPGMYLIRISDSRGESIHRVVIE